MSEDIKVQISEDVLQLFEALPAGGVSRRGHDWTPKEDFLLKQYWPIRNQRRVAELLGLNITTCRERYRKLVCEE